MAVNEMELREKVRKFLRDEVSEPTYMKFVEQEFMEKFYISKPEVQAKIRKGAREHNTSNFEYVRKNMGVLQTIEECWGEMKKQDLHKLLVVHVGRTVGDGFIGLKMSRRSYEDRYVVEVSRGSQPGFLKTYLEKPKKEWLIGDYICALSNSNIGVHQVGLSIGKIWREEERNYNLENVVHYVVYNSEEQRNYYTQKHKIGEQILVCQGDGELDHGILFERTRRSERNRQTGWKQAGIYML